MRWHGMEVRPPAYDNFDAACRYFKRSGYSRDDVAAMLREGTIELKVFELGDRQKEDCK